MVVDEEINFGSFWRSGIALHARSVQQQRTEVELLQDLTVV